MPAAYRKGDLSTGACGDIPTTLTLLIQCEKSFVNGILVGVVGDQHVVHPLHPIPGLRQIASGALKTYWEGIPAARTGDPIVDGDTCGEGSYNTFIE